MSTSTITDIETAMLARAEATLGTGLRAYLPLPGGAGQLAAALTSTTFQAPCLFAAWAGSEVAPKAAELRLVSRWVLLACTRLPVGETTRRQGAGGTYALAATLARALHDYTLPGVGTLQVERLAPIEVAGLAERALSLTAVTVSLLHDLADEDDAGGLNDFLTWHADYDLEPVDGVVAFGDTLLRQANADFAVDDRGEPPMAEPEYSPAPVADSLDAARLAGALPPAALPGAPVVVPATTDQPAAPGQPADSSGG